MVQVLGVAEVAVEREVTGDVSFADPVDQLTEQDRVIFKRFARGRALIPLLEPAEHQRIMLAAGTDIIGDEIVMSDLVALLRVVPEPADILEELSVVVDEHIVARDHALMAVARVGRFLQPLQPPRVQRGDIPIGLGEEAVQARLVGRLGELAIDPRHTFPLGDHQAGEILAPKSIQQGAAAAVRRQTGRQTRESLLEPPVESPRSLA